MEKIPFIYTRKKLPGNQSGTSEFLFHWVYAFVSTREITILKKSVKEKVGINNCLQLPRLVGRFDQNTYNQNNDEN